VAHTSGAALATITPQGVVDLRGALRDEPTLTNLDVFCAVLDDRPEARAQIEEVACSAEPTWAAEEVRLLAPLRRPSKVVCIGLNYRDHCRETGTAVPRAPVVFAKFPSAIVGPGEPIHLYPGLTQELDWEVELVAVIGNKVGPGSPGDLKCVLGYTVGNDISARDLQRQEGQWVRSKSCDSWCPIGPTVVTADELGDPQRLRLGLNLNGKAKQDSHTAEMIFPVADLIRWVSAGATLVPGDLIFTGTPFGTGGYEDPPRYLTEGDVVEAWIENIGSLTNHVVH
jgi:2-keto-4-pentenoate hydratase/2-oxohepta-3-ene-1,7-dioic acid hydratase in catechol pathway